MTKERAQQIVQREADIMGLALHPNAVGVIANLWLSNPLVSLEGVLCGLRRLQQKPLDQKFNLEQLIRL